MSDAYRKKPYLRYCLKIDAKTKYLSGQNVYVSEKLQISRMECRFLESNDVKKFAIKYNIKTNPIDFDELSNEKHDFYKVEIDGEEVEDQEPEEAS